MLLLFQTTEKICFYLKWKNGHNSPKFKYFYFLHNDWFCLLISIDIYRGKKISTIRQTVWPVERGHTNTHTNIHTARKLRNHLLFFYGPDSRVLPYHVRGTGIKTQLSLCFCCCWCWSHFFYLQKMMQKLFFQKNKLSGDIGLMVQMLNLNFVAAAISNYWENLFLLKMEKEA